jgi:hypothetical protein
VRNEASMLRLSLTAQTFSCRPSSFVTGLSGFEAYCLDSACALFLNYYMSGKKPKNSVMDDDATLWL